MLPKVLLILLNAFLIIQSRVKPHTEAEVEPSTHDNVVYGPQPQPRPQPQPLPQPQPPPHPHPPIPPVGRKLLSEETKPTDLITTGRPGGKLEEVSHILNDTLSKYDPKLRPGIGERPTVVTVEFSVYSLGPLSIMNMEYTIEIIFCQTWYDERLRYNDTLETLVLQGNLVSLLWILDTYFRNSRKIEEHHITMPNQMIRIHQDGKVLHTIRLTIDAGCTFHMLKFPMDSHSCPLSFSSFSYVESEMIYKWADFNLELNEKNSWKLYQFEVTGVSNKTEIANTPSGEFMILTFIFNVSRQFGYFALQNYVPSSVTTMLSWVSFWIKESAPARASLGITSVLTVTTLGTFSRKTFPRVSYITALDFYIAICFVFCFCALMEFAVLNFLTYNWTKAPDSPRGSHLLRVHGIAHPRARARARARACQEMEVFVCEIVTDERSEEEEGSHCLTTCSGSPKVPSPKVCDRLACFRYFKGLKKYICMVPDCEASTWQQGRLRFHVYRLDNYSRVVFPLTFFIFNVIYWLACFNL